MTQNVEERLKVHNKKQVKSTKSKSPWKVVYVEKHRSLLDARKREKCFKSAAGRRFRKNKLGL